MELLKLLMVSGLFVGFGGGLDWVEGFLLVVFVGFSFCLAIFQVNFGYGWLIWLGVGDDDGWGLCC